MKFQGRGKVGGEKEMGRDIEGMSRAYIIPPTLKLYGFHCTRQEKVLLRAYHMWASCHVSSVLRIGPLEVWGWGGGCPCSRPVIISQLCVHYECVSVSAHARHVHVSLHLAVVSQAQVLSPRSPQRGQPVLVACQ